MRLASLRWLVVILSLASSAHIKGSDDPTARDKRPWVPPDSRLGVRTAPILLLTRADVQAELGLDHETVLALDRIVGELHGRAARLRGKPDAEALSQRRAIDEAQNEWIEGHLLPDQRKRLLQIDIQWEGPSAIVTRPWLASQIKLTPEQRSRLARAVAEARAIEKSGKPSTVAAHSRLASEVMATLTPAQSERWKELKGPPFASAELAQTRKDPAVGKAGR
jgi:hypothetical protein